MFESSLLAYTCLKAKGDIGMIKSICLFSNKSKLIFDCDF